MYFSSTFYFKSRPGRFQLGCAAHSGCFRLLMETLIANENWSVLSVDKYRINTYASYFSVDLGFHKLFQLSKNNPMLVSIPNPCDVANAEVI